MIWRDNLFATQFHPEKSQRDGLRMLQEFRRAVSRVSGREIDQPPLADRAAQSALDSRPAAGLGFRFSSLPHRLLPPLCFRGRHRSMAKTFASRHFSRNGSGNRAGRIARSHRGRYRCAGHAARSTTPMRLSDRRRTRSARRGAFRRLRGPSRQWPAVEPQGPARCGSSTPIR